MALRASSQITERARTVLRWALFALLLASPLPFGAVQPWAVLTLELYAALLGALALFVLARDPQSLTRKARWLLVAAGCVLAVGILQLLPGLGRLSPETFAIRERVFQLVPQAASSVAPASLEPAATVDALLRFVAYLLIGLAAATAVRRPRHLMHAAVVLVVAAAFQGLYGSAEYLTGRQHIFGYAKQHFDDEASGTFINRNHYAGYLAMLLPLALGLILEGVRRMPSARCWRDRALRLTEPPGLWAVLGGVAAGLIWMGLILSYSRGGLAVAFAGVACMLVATAARGRQLKLLAAVLILPTAFLLFQQARAPGERLVAGAVNLDTVGGRLPVWRSSLQMVPGHLAVGTGMGTYAGAFALHQPPDLAKRWDHAHNDWLQALVEGGIPTTLAFVALLLLSVGPYGLQAGTRTSRPLLAACVPAAILVIALHSFVGFGLRIPAIAVLTACLVGLSCAVANEPGATVASLERAAR